ncbi:MAG TPA: hypothetical protein DG753_07605 [Clostridium sp.]|nr:hypothetical protein [Clostridium sp.]
MNKKKLFYVVSIVFIVIFIGWSIFPYIFTSSNLISKNNYKYEYYEIDIYKLHSHEDAIGITKDESNRMNGFIKAIDNLKVKRTTRPEDEFHNDIYDIDFTATYKGKDNILCTKEVFSITLYKDNVIGFREGSTGKQKFYKIQDDKFNIEDFINNFK